MCAQCLLRSTLRALYSGICLSTCSKTDCLCCTVVYALLQIEERNEDLHKLRKKNTTTVQVLQTAFNGFSMALQQLLKRFSSF
jgi:hypothetical protein